MNIDIKKLEEVTEHKVKRNFRCIGFDTAARTGVSFLYTDDKCVKIDWIFLDFKDLKDKKKIYRTMVKTFENVIDNQDFATIEQVFVGFNRAGSVELSRYGSFAISECIRKDIDYELISAVSCRSKLGIKTTKAAGYGKGQSKRAVADWLENNLNVKLDDEDISDAIILGILGLCEGLDFSAKGKKK